MITAYKNVYVVGADIYKMHDLFLYIETDEN